MNPKRGSTTTWIFIVLWLKRFDLLSDYLAICKLMTTNSSRFILVMHDLDNFWIKECSIRFTLLLMDKTDVDLLGYFVCCSSLTIFITIIVSQIHNFLQVCYNLQKSTFSFQNNWSFLKKKKICLTFSIFNRALVTFFSIVPSN